ncbi:MAG: ATP-dependent helicase/nuclease subunit [Eubacteriales bacterium]|nr:ATP-dependent helicase/nuclease subunit [Eubacteriales bacterium]
MAMTKKWTEEQEKAISCRGACVLVAAAAGAGKTSVLVERVAGLITAPDPSQRVPVDRLLVVTFTRAAAEELRERIGRRLKDMLAADPANTYLQEQIYLLPAAHFSTFHSFCKWVVDNYGILVGVSPGQRVLEEGEEIILQEQALDGLFRDYYHAGNEIFLDLVDRYGGLRSDRGLKEMILTLYRYAAVHPYPLAWLQEKERDYGNLTSLAATPWAEAIKKEIARQWQRGEDFLRAALCLARQEGQERVEELLTRDLETLAKLRDACQKEWPELQKAVLEAKFDRWQIRGLKGEKVEWIKHCRRQAQNVVKRVKDKYFSRSQEEWLEELTGLTGSVQALFGLVREFTARYQEEKKKVGCLDFNDLEHLTLQILSGKGADGVTVAGELREKFRFILVDEYQDINPTQEEILNLLCGAEKEKLFMVGDIKQSIYRFRLAVPEIFLDKYRSFSTREGDKELRLDLSHNFRSRPEVVAGINFLCRQIMREDVAEVEYDERAELRCAAFYPPRPDGCPVPVEVHIIQKNEDENGERENERKEGAEIEAEDIRLEARVIARRIKEMMAAGFPVYDPKKGEYRPCSYGDIAVLLRTIRSTGEVVAAEFTAAGVPVFIDTGGSLLETTEGNLFLALLAIIDNPRQDIPLAAVLLSPVGGFTPEELALLRSRYPKGELYDLLRQAEAEEKGEKVKEFLRRLKEWRQLSTRMDLPSFLNYLLQETPLLEYAGSLPGGRQRQANLRLMVEHARTYQELTAGGLDGLLRYFEALRRTQGTMEPARLSGEGEEVVRVMSVHRSKGLEFPVVFVAGLGLSFNLGSAGPLILHRDLGVGINAVDPDARLETKSFARLAVEGKVRRESLAEEIRILYVALTRAKEKLILVGTVKDLAKKVREQWLPAALAAADFLPAGHLFGARCFLDWIGPALLRHPNGESLRLAGGEDLTGAVNLISDSSVWEFFLHRAGDLMRDTEGAIPAEREECLRHFLPFAGVPEEKVREIKERFFFTYPCLKATHLPAKFAATEIKTLFGSAPEEEESWEESLSLPVIFLPEEDEIAPVEVGSAYHLVLYHIDLHGDTSPATVAAVIARLVEGGLLTEAQAGEVDPAQIAAVLASPLGERLRQGKRVWRELPFLLPLPARELDPAFPGEDMVLVQGVIDCLLEEEDGFVLIDWKSDRVNTREEMAARAEIYRGQLEIYARAVVAVTGRPVKEKYLYFLRSGTLWSL